MAVLSLFALPAAANAVVYCVPNDTIDVSCTSGQGQATIQAALTTAEGTTAVSDTVRIDAGSYGEANLIYNDTTPENVVNVIGDGPAQTLLTIPDTTGTATGLRIVAPTGSSVSNLAMTIPANAGGGGEIGIFLTGVVFGHNLLVDGPSASNATGIRLTGGSGLDTSTVNLPFGVPNSNEAVTTISSNSTVTDVVLHADTGVRNGSLSGNVLTIDRAQIQAKFAGVSEDSGNVNVRNSIIDLGSNSGAVGVQAANFNPSTTAMAAHLEGDTIVGGGSNSTGVHAQADSAVGNDPNDTVHNGEDSTVSVDNTILSGQTHSLRVEADRGETATITTSYSNYDSSSKVVTSDLTPGGGTGTAFLSESNQTNLAPGFVSASDFHLASGSALIDAGDPAGPPVGDEDIDGDNREIFGKDSCDGPRRDIGADEFDPVTPPTLLDCIPPDTILDSGPTGAITDNTPTFTFHSSEQPATFQCSIDGGPLQACISPFTSVPLPDGTHTLAVQAIDASSNADPSPAARSFTVDTTAPDTAIGSHPKAKTKSRKATFTFSSTEAGSTFLCSFDGKPYAACTSPFTTPKLARGKHRFDVIATDSLGNRDQSAATFFWKVKKRKRHRR